MIALVDLGDTATMTADLDAVRTILRTATLHIEERPGAVVDVWQGWTLSLETTSLAAWSTTIIGGVMRLDYTAKPTLIPVDSFYLWSKEFVGLDLTAQYYAQATFTGIQIVSVLYTVLDLEGNGNSHIITSGEKDGTPQVIITQTVNCPPDGKLTVTLGLQHTQNGDQGHREIDEFSEVQLIKVGGTPPPDPDLLPALRIAGREVPVLEGTWSQLPSLYLGARARMADKNRAISTERDEIRVFECQADLYDQTDEDVLRVLCPRGQAVEVTGFLPDGVA